MYLILLVAFMACSSPTRVPICGVEGKWELKNVQGNSVAIFTYTFTDTNYTINITNNNVSIWNEEGVWECGEDHLLMYVRKVTESAFKGTAYRMNFQVYGDYIWLGKYGGKRK